MSSAPTPDEIWKDARWLAQAVDPRAGLVRSVEMTAEDYRRASFLDDRMFDEQRASHLLGWNNVANAKPPTARTDAKWIFHIGHVGSTLIARLLGELKSALSVREPRALRDLTFFPPDIRNDFLPAVRALMSRTFDADETAVVKATSFVSEIATELTARTNQALHLYATPEAYIAGILAGENSRKELAGLADLRRQRLASRGMSPPQPRNDADAAAIAWACEMTSLEAADGANCLWAGFDGILSNLEPSLQKITDHFGIAASADEIHAIANGPILRRYSKATEFEYSPQLRRDLLTEAHQSNRVEIESALAMLAAASETAPLLRKALDRAQKPAVPES